MSTSGSQEGLARSAARRSADARRKILKALREMGKKGLDINVNAVSRYAGVARKTIYNHPDLLEQVRSVATTSALRPVPADPPDTPTASGLTAALRNQVLALKGELRTKVAELTAIIKDRDTQLAVAHGEIHRLTEQLRHRRFPEQKPSHSPAPEPLRQRPPS